MSLKYTYESDDNFKLNPNNNTIQKIVSEILDRPNFLYFVSWGNFFLLFSFALSLSVSPAWENENDTLQSTATACGYHCTCMIIKVKGGWGEGKKYRQILFVCCWLNWLACLLSFLFSIPFWYIIFSVVLVCLCRPWDFGANNVDGWWLFCHLFPPFFRLGKVAAAAAAAKSKS